MDLISKALRYDLTARSHSFTCHQHEPYLSLLRKHSPDGATPTEVADIYIAIVAYCSFVDPKRMKD